MTPIIKVGLAAGALFIATPAVATLDSGPNGASSVNFGIRGFSNWVQIAPLIPEAATWGMMLLGVGAMGFVMRPIRSQHEQLQQIA